MWIHVGLQPHPAAPPGNPINAYLWILSNGGITSEALYPYIDGDGHCASVCEACQAATSVASIADAWQVNKGDTNLATALVQQPITVAVDAGGTAWQFYAGGVLTSSCGSALNHAVLAVGYGTLGADDYWTVKNSWGTGWGERGYILLGRGAQYGANGQCGILIEATFPTK